MLSIFSSITFLVASTTSITFAPTRFLTSNTIAPLPLTRDQLSVSEYALRIVAISPNFKLVFSPTLIGNSVSC